MISSLLKPTIAVNGKKYKILSQIGEGGFAFVYNVRSINKEDKNENYALKKMICQLDEQMAEAKKEIDLMLKIKHPNVLELLGFSYAVNKKGQSEVYLLLPLYMGTVQSMIDQGVGYPVSGFTDGLDIVHILRQCVEGLIAVHNSGFRHADLKPANILLTADYHAVLTDFGSASTITEIVTTRAEALTIQDKAAQFTTASFRAPELHSTPSSCVVDGKSDVWSFGCVMYAMLYSRTPFETAMEGLSVLAVMSGQYHIPESNLWPQDYLEIIERCLVVDCEQRLATDELQLRLKRVTSPPLDLRQEVKPPSPVNVAPDTPFSAPTQVPPVSAAAAASKVAKSKDDTPNSPTPTSPFISASPTPPAPLLSKTNIHGRSMSLTGNFADFDSEQAVAVVAFETEADDQLAQTRGDSSGSGGDGEDIPPLRPAASRDEFGDAIRRPGGSISTVVPFDAFTATPLAAEQQGSHENGQLVLTLDTTITVRQQQQHDDDEEVAIRASRSYFTDSTGTNDTSYVLSEAAFDSQSTLATTFTGGGPSPKGNGASGAVIRVPSHGSYGEFVFMDAAVKSNAGDSNSGHNSNLIALASDSSAGIALEGFAFDSPAEQQQQQSQQQQQQSQQQQQWQSRESNSTSPVVVSEVDSADNKTMTTATLVNADGTGTGTPSLFEEVGVEGEGEDDFGDFADSTVNASATGGGADADDWNITEVAETARVTPTPPSDVVQQSGFVATFPFEPSAESHQQQQQQPNPQKATHPPALKTVAVTTKTMRAEDSGDEVVEPIDLYRVILGQSMSASASASATSSGGSGGSGHSSRSNTSDTHSCVSSPAAPLRMVIKEGPVYILRLGGFPKKMTRKQVWMVLTASGLVLRKDAGKDSKVHEVLSLHRPVGLTATDTMAIGLHGLLIQGSAPKDLRDAHAHDVASSASDGSSSSEDWINVTLADLTIDHSEKQQQQQMQAQSSTATSTGADCVTPNTLRKAKNARVFRSQFTALRCEVAFDSKDVMNEWIDAIEAQREVCCVYGNSGR